MQFLVRSLPNGDTIVSQRQMFAADETSLRAALAAANHVVLSIKAQSDSFWTFTKQVRFNFPLFCKELQTLIRAGMTVVEAVDTLAQKDAAIDRKNSLAFNLMEKLEQGQSLSTALEGLSDVPTVLVAAVRAGERTSNLSEALKDYLHFDSLIAKLKTKIISASIYPALVTALGITISIFLLLVVMPNFARMYQNLRGTAKGTTAWMIDVSQYLSLHRQEAVVLAVGVVMLIGLWIQSGFAKRFFVRTMYAIPWVRTRIQDFQLAMVYQALALLLKGGYSMTQAIALASQSALSKDTAMGLQSALHKIEQGASVSRSFADAGLCDEVDRRLMAAAERNGDFFLAADVVSRMHSERFELFVERVTRVVEPVLLLLVALIVGAIVVMMYLPVFDMATRLR